MKKLTLVLIASLSLASGRAFAADDSFVGKWKFNPEKSQLNGLDYKIEDTGDGKYTFAFGDDVETMTLDGKGHMTKYGNTWSVKATGPNTWESTMKREGKVIATEKWTVSEDNQTFTSMAENKRPDGTTGQTESTFKRTAGTTGLAGTWQSASIKVLSPTTMEIAKWQKDGYSMSNPTYKDRLNFKFDGKDYTPTGPRVAKGMTVSAEKVDDHTMELTYKLKGKTIETDRWELAADGKTLTDSIVYPGVTKQEVDVLDRQ